MWYFNDDFIHEKGYTIVEAIILQLLHQNRSSNKENSLAMYSSDEMLEKFDEQGLIKRVKKKRKDESDFSVLRLSKKGSELLDSFGTPEISVGDEEMFTFLCDMYLSNEDGERSIGNKKKTKMYCAIFRQKMSLSLHEMYWLCRFFLQEYKFTKVLQYLFFNDNKNRYGTFEGNFEDSPLYQFLDERREEVEKLWQQKIKE